MSQSPIKYVSIMFSSPVRILRIIYICTHTETYIENFVFSFFFLNKKIKIPLPPSLLHFASPSLRLRSIVCFFLFIIILYFILIFIIPFLAPFFFRGNKRKREKKKTNKKTTFTISFPLIFFFLFLFCICVHLADRLIQLQSTSQPTFTN